VFLDDASAVGSSYRLRRIRRLREQLAAMDAESGRANCRQLTAVILVATTAADREPRAFDVGQEVATARATLEGDRARVHH
jgi:hypothetical protein